MIILNFELLVLNWESEKGGSGKVGKLGGDGMLKDKDQRWG